MTASLGGRDGTVEEHTLNVNSGRKVHGASATRALYLERFVSPVQ